MLERTTESLRESVVLLQELVQETRNNSTSLTQQDTAYAKDSELTSTIQVEPMRPTGSASPTHADEQTFPGQTHTMENISVGNNSRQTIIVEGRGSVKTRNIATGDGLVQFIGRLSDATLQKLMGS